MIFIRIYLHLKSYIYLPEIGWSEEPDATLDSENTVVIIFADSDKRVVYEPISQLFGLFEKAHIVGCSTAGEIFEDELHIGSVVATVMKMECSKIRVASRKVDKGSDVFEIGSSLMDELCSGEDLPKGVFTLSDGLNINGSELTRGLNSSISEASNIVVTGALAGDDDRFESTWVIVDGELRENCVTAVGFYGESLQIGFGSQGGWDRFGIDRVVTKSKGNVLYTLDGKPALDLYKKYLGEYAKELPASGLLFPLQVKEGESEPKVRTILSVNEDESSITFAGDIVEGSRASFMKANLDNLITGAESAAFKIEQDGYEGEDALLIAVSCVGRRLILGPRSEDELEVVREVFPKSVKMVGFYSYGEISTQKSGRCDLLNQTMTLTWIWEKCI